MNGLKKAKLENIVNKIRPMHEDYMHIDIIVATLTHSYRALYIKDLKRNIRLLEIYFPSATSSLPSPTVYGRAMFFSKEYQHTLKKLNT